MAGAQNKNRIVLLIIFGMSVIPFLIALFLGGNAPFITGRINKGELISPAVPTELADFIGIDAFSADNKKELRGRWVMMNIVSKETCDQACLAAIHKTRQLQLMMNKDITRTRRAVLSIRNIRPELVGGWFKDDQFLLKFNPGEALLKSINGITKGNIRDGMLFLIDPLGNLMMQYEPGFDPYKVKSDLMHLLRVSQIG